MRGKCTPSAFAARCLWPVRDNSSLLGIKCVLFLESEVINAH